MSLDQQGGDTAAEHRIVRFAHRAHVVLDDLVDAPAWTLTADQARQSLLDLTRLQDRVVELRLRVLAAADTLDVGADNGCTSTAAWLADRTRVTRAQAHADLRLARLLDSTHPVTRAAFATGALHEDQARVIVTAVGDLAEEASTEDRDRAERHLIGLAQEYDAPVLRRFGRRVFEVIAPEEADRREGEALEREEAEARRRTSLRMRDNGDGTWSGSFKIPDLHAAMLRTALHALTSPRRRHLTSDASEAFACSADSASSTSAASPGAPASADPGSVRTGTAEALGLGFVELIERFPAARLPQSGGVNATVVVTMTLDQLRSALGAAGLTTGELISAAEARRLACRAGIIPAVLGGRSEVLDLGRKRRFHSSAQRIALTLESGGCTAETCDRPAAWAEAHHTVPWSEGGGTSVREGRLLCPRHHHLAHDSRYDLTRLPSGQVRFHRRT